MIVIGTKISILLKKLSVRYVGISIRTIALEENCPPDNCSLDDCPPPDYWPPDNCSRGKLPPRQLPPRKIAPWMVVPRLLLPENYPKNNFPLTISPGNCPLRKVPFGWFIAHIITPRRNGPEDLFRLNGLVFHQHKALCTLTKKMCDFQ